VEKERELKGRPKIVGWTIAHTQGEKLLFCAEEGLGFADDVVAEDVGLDLILVVLDKHAQELTKVTVQRRLFRIKDNLVCVVKAEKVHKNNSTTKKKQTENNILGVS